VTTPDGRDPPAGADPVAELEAFIAETEKRGEPVPPEARAMLARLRELMAALHGLTASLEQRPPTTTPEEESERD
jgi:hypothetical protein